MILEWERAHRSQTFVWGQRCHNVILVRVGGEAEDRGAHGPLPPPNTHKNDVMTRFKRQR